MKKISIIVPVYNAEKYLTKCLNSLSFQTYKELEIIAVDDGSTDKSGQILADFAKRDNRIKVIHSENHGVSHARNIGLDVATGEYVGFVDSDDWVDKDFFEKLLQAIEENNGDIAGAGFVLELPHKTQYKLTVKDAQNFSRERAIEEIFAIAERPLLIWSLWDKLIKHELIPEIRFDENLKLSEDQYFMWQVLGKIKKFVYVPSLGYHYRMNEASATHKKTTSQQGTYLAAMERILAESKKIELSFKTRYIIEMKYNQTVVRVLRDILLSGDKALIAEFKPIQNNLRKKLIACLREPYFGNIRKLAAIILCLPLGLLQIISPILNKASDIIMTKLWNRKIC